MQFTFVPSRSNTRVASPSNMLLCFILEEHIKAISTLCALPRFTSKWYFFRPVWICFSAARGQLYPSNDSHLKVPSIKCTRPILTSERKWLKTDLSKYPFWKNESRPHRPCIKWWALKANAALKSRAILAALYPNWTSLCLTRAWARAEVRGLSHKLSWRK